MKLEKFRSRRATLLVVLVLAALALAATVLVVSAAPSSPAMEYWDSSCGVTYPAFDPQNHSVLVPQANGIVSCWTSESGVRMWEIRQPNMAGSDPTKPAYGIYFPVPQAQQCSWWGWQATLWNDAGGIIAPRFSMEGLNLGVNPARYGATVEDPDGGVGAGFLLVCSGVVGDQNPTPTPTPTRTPTPTMTPTATPSPEGFYQLEQSGTTVEVVYEGHGDPFMDETSVIYSTRDFPSVLVTVNEIPCWSLTLCGWRWTPAAPVQASGGLLWGVKIPDTRFPLITSLPGWRIDGKWFLRGTTGNPDMIPRVFIPFAPHGG